MPTRKFTLFELLVVGVILVCVTAIALPMLSRLPQRVTVENALSDLRRTFSETSMRARATGVGLSLVLYEEEQRFALTPVQPIAYPAAARWTPEVQTAEGYEETVSAAIAVKETYAVADAIQWQLENSDELPVFSFFPDGQAAGLPVRFSIGKIQYQLDVDTLTGDALIEELSPGSVGGF